MYFQSMHYGLGGIQSAPAVIEPEGDEEKGAAVPLHPPPPFAGIYPLNAPSYSKLTVANTRPLVLHQNYYGLTQAKLQTAQRQPRRRMVHPICVKPKILKSLPFKKRQMTKTATKKVTKVNLRHTLPPLKSTSRLPMGRPLFAPPNLPKLAKGVTILRKDKTVPMPTTNTSS